MTTAEHLSLVRHTQLLVNAGKGILDAAPPSLECDMFHKGGACAESRPRQGIYLPMIL